MDRDALVRRRRRNRRILLFLVGPIGLVFAWLASLGTPAFLFPATVCVLLAIGAFFMDPTKV